MVNLAQRNIEAGGRNLQIASNYLETWDDSDSITAIIAQKDLRQSQKWWHNHSEAQYQGSEINYEYTEIVGTELRLEIHQHYKSTG